MWGVDPIWAEVKESIPCSRGTVHRLMKRHGIKSRRKEKWIATTNSKHNLPVAPNLLKQNFDVDTPNAVWVGDITYNWTDKGWLYTAIVKDLCTKKVVRLCDEQKDDPRTCNQRIAVRRETPSNGLIFHSDRGSQYCSKGFGTLLEADNIQQSMSRKGNPYGNACAESFFSCLQCECTNFNNFRTRDGAKQVTFEYSEFYYNRQRRHATLGWITPLKFKEQLNTLPLAG